MAAPWFKFYPDDWVGGRAAGLTLGEQGTYLRLLIRDWACDGLPDDVEELLRPLPREVSEPMAIELRETFFERCADGRWRNPKLNAERLEATARMLKASKAAQARWAGNSSQDQHGPEVDNAPSNAPSNASSNARASLEHMLERCQPEPDPDPEPEVKMTRSKASPTRPYAGPQENRPDPQNQGQNQGGSIHPPLKGRGQGLPTDVGREVLVTLMTALGISSRGQIAILTSGVPYPQKLELLQTARNRPGIEDRAGYAVGAIRTAGREISP